jgi:vacuolar-type H+-ATPase subunit I/STV1
MSEDIITSVSSTNSAKDFSVQDTLKFFRSLTDEDKQYFVDHMGQGVLDRVIKAARQEEKNKLYPDLEKKTSTINTLQQELDQVKSMLQQNSQSALSVEEQIKQKESELLKMLEDKQKEFDSRASQFEQKVRDAELRAHRAEVLKEHNVPKHLEKYVMGDSEEALQEAAKNAVLTYNEMKAALLEEFKKDAPPVQQTILEEPSQAEKQPQQQQQVNPLPEQRLDSTFVLPSPDVNNSQANNHVFTAEEIQRMSPSDYARNRELIQSQMRDRLAQTKL